MTHVRSRPFENLVCGFLYSDEKKYETALDAMSQRYGRPDVISDEWVFKETGYYEKEMGSNLKKRLVSFERLLDPALLYQVKLFAIETEDALLLPSGARSVNLDPGTLSLGKFILATAKDYWHRIQIGGGILAEVTLRYDSEKKSFVKWECTYPDFAKTEYIDFLNKIRELYVEKIKDFPKPL